MMTTQQIAIYANFGNEFDMGVLEPGKVRIKLGTGLVRNADGSVTVDLEQLVTHALSLTGSSLTSTVNGVSDDVDLTPAIKAAETLTTFNYDPATHIVTFVGENGVAGTHDLSALSTDIFLDGSAWDPSTMVLTLTDNDGDTPDVTVNLADLAKSVTADSPTVAFTGEGTAASPLSAAVKLSTATTGNLAKQTPDGVAVDPADITGLATVDVEDLFGNPLFKAFPA